MSLDCANLHYAGQHLQYVSLDIMNLMIHWEVIILTIHYSLFPFRCGFLNSMPSADLEEVKIVPQSLCLTFCLAIVEFGFFRNVWKDRTGLDEQELQHQSCFRQYKVALHKKENFISFPCWNKSTLDKQSCLLHSSKLLLKMKWFCKEKSFII